MTITILIICKSAYFRYYSNMTMKRFLLSFVRWIPALCIFGVSFYLSGKSTIENMPTFLFADKLVHFICFSGLAFWVAFGCSIKGKKKIEILLPALIVSCYGIFDEIHQSFIPGRMMSFGDWLTDSLGGIFGSFVFFMIMRLFNIKQA